VVEVAVEAEVEAKVEVEAEVEEFTVYGLQFTVGAVAPEGGCWWLVWWFGLWFGLWFGFSLQVSAFRFSGFQVFS